MIEKLSKSAILFLGIWLSCLAPTILHAENHALLIGIGNYEQRTLEGPAHDVQALSNMLATNYNFSKRNIRTLINREAGKSRILSEMERLVRRSHPGDRVFIYFSGHGTSRRDEMLSLPLPHSSGALVPADFKWDPEQPVEDQVSQLVVGKRDLRPILIQLDRDRQVLIVFDTCFSGNSVRGIGEKKSVMTSRYLPLGSRSIFSDEQYIGNFAENLRVDDSYPYQNTFYISASSENETAKDIRSDLLYLYPTIDGNPHGVLTDSLLRVLAGQMPVDTNNDGRWSQIELYRAIRSEVQRRFRQTPQALPKDSENTDRLYNRTFFVRSAGSIRPAVEKTPGFRHGITIRVSNGLSKLKMQISRIEGVKIVEKNADLLLIEDRGDIVLTLPNLHPLCRFTSFEIDRVLDRIRRHQAIQPLIDFSYPSQQFNVYLELTGPYQKNIIREGESFGFEIRTEKRAYMLLIDIDPVGAVHVLYPFDQSELQPIAPGPGKILAEKSRALWPFGTETLKLFAFRNMPVGLEALVGRQDIYPGSEAFKTLEKIVGIRGRSSSKEATRNDTAQAVLQITSYAKADMQK